MKIKQKSKIKFNILILCGVFFICLNLIGIYSVVFKTSAETYSDVDKNNLIKEEYLFNSEFEMPVKEVEKNGKKELAEVMLFSPSNKAYDSKRVQLDEIGEWVIRYTAFNESTYEKFTVYQKTYEVTDKNGTITYGKNKLFSKLTDGAVPLSGLMVKIPKGSSFKYNNVIDISQNTYKQNIITFGVFPNNVGVADISSLSIFLTDIYDENNYIEYRMVNPNNDAPAYMGMGCLATSFTGAESYMGLNSTSEFGVEKYHCNNPFYGAYTPCPFEGERYKVSKYVEPVTSIGYEPATKRCFSNTKSWSGKGGAPYNTLIADLSRTDYSDAILGGNGKTFVKEFGGFTTGEVYLSIKADGYMSPDCNVFIKEIQGIDFEGMSTEGITSSKSYDIVSPIVDVNLEDYQEENLPVAKVGTPYNFFEAKAKDNKTTGLDLLTHVYFIKNNSRIFRCSNDGTSFIPNIEGTYEIVYSSFDGSRNKVEKSLYIKALNDVPMPKISMSSNRKTIKTGTNMLIPIPEVEAYSGKAKLDYYISYEGRNISISNNSFYVEKPGIYTINYKVYDYLKQSKEFKFEIEAKNDINPIVNEAIVLPNAFIAGSEYEITPPVGLYFEGNKKSEIKPEIYVTDGKAERKINNTYIPFSTKDGNNTAQFKFIYKSEKGQTIINSERPIIVIDNLKNDLIKYFSAEGNVCVENNNGILCQFTGNDGKVQFVKSIFTKDFNLELQIIESNNINSNKNEYINIILQDYLNKDKEIIISIFSIDNKIKMSINGGKLYNFDADFTGKSSFNISYNDIYRQVIAKQGGVKVLTDKNGNKFDGFADHKAYLIINVSNAEDFSLKIKKINNQTFDKYTTEDYIYPEFSLNGEPKSEYELNTEVKTIIASAIDVLQENCFITLSVLSPNNEFILKDVAAMKEHRFVLNEYGRYQLIYKCVDSKGNSVEIPINYNVYERISPELEIDGEDFKCDVNKLIKLPKATFKDNITADENIKTFINIQSPDGKKFLIDIVRNNNTFFAEYKFDKQGFWLVQYMVYDDNYNVTEKEIKVLVGELSVNDIKNNDELILVSNTKSNYFITIPSNSTTELSAAKNLQEYIYKSTGCLLEIKIDGSFDLGDNEKYISIGKTSFYNNSDIAFDLKSLNGDGFIIKEINSNIYIIGGDKEKSYIYASQYFLEKTIGYEVFYLDEIIYDCLDELKTPHFDVVEIPTFRHRYTYNQDTNGCKSPAEYKDLMRQDDIIWTSVGGGHTIFKFLPPEIYCDKEKHPESYHPEWYSNKGAGFPGKRDQVCWSQEDMIEEISKNIINHVKENPLATHVKVSQNDGHNWCHCAECEKISKKYGADSAVLLRAYNKIADNLQAYIDENEPGRIIYLTTSAYTTTEKPPVKLDSNGNYVPIDESVVVRDNIAVRVAPIYTDFAHDLYDEKFNESQRNNFKGWKVICKNMAVWSYDTNFNDYFIPFCNWNSIQDNYKFMKECNVNAVLEQGAWNSKQVGFIECKNYVRSKLMWNCNLDMQDLIKEFFDNYYKDASGYMYKYFDEYRQWSNILESRNVSIGMVYGRYNSVEDALPLSVISRWENYLNLAKKEIEYIKDIDENLYNKIYDRIDKETLFFDFVRIFKYTDHYYDDELHDMRLSFMKKCSYFDIKNNAETSELKTTYAGWGL